MKNILHYITSWVTWFKSHLTGKPKRKGLEPFDADFFLNMDRLAVMGEIGFSVERCTFVMSTEFYNEFLCDGAMTMLNDEKAHTFFHKLRQ